MTNRANYLPAPNFFELNHACRILNDALGSFGCYLVGSSRERRDYRDVDVRFILEDSEFDRIFGKTTGAYYYNPLWSVMCASIALWLQQRTGLPVDFQIQRQTEANRDFPGANKRDALGIFLDYPGGK